jgi:hypothetical protein
MKYTVMINGAEFGSGIYNTYEEAEKAMAKIILEDEPHLIGKSVEEIIDYDEDGYYRILDIHMDDNKINVGDKVILKDYLQLYEIYNGVMMTGDMEDLKGKVLTVTTVESDEDDEDVLYIHLKECPFGYWYTDAMLEVIE